MAGSPHRSRADLYLLELPSVPSGAKRAAERAGGLAKWPLQIELLVAGKKGTGSVRAMVRM
jgi:hypothetical protein